MLGNGSGLALMLGQLGSDYFNDTAIHNGDWGIIYCIAACTFTTLTSGVKDDGSTVMSGTLANITLAAGMSIFGRFSRITLASGSVLAYKI